MNFTRVPGKRDFERLLGSLVLFGIFLLYSAQVRAFGATTRQVGAGQTYSTIQSCLSAAVSGDTCNVHAGTYNENAIFQGSGITLQANPGDQPVVNGSIDIGSNANSVVDGFTIPSFSRSGSGAIHAYNTTGGIIRNNIVSGGLGAGIYVRLCTNFKVYGNTTYRMTGSPGGTDADGLVITSANSTDGTYAHGVQIYNNTVYENHQDGIIINGNWLSIFGNLVHDNIYSDALSTHPDGIECNGVSDGYTGCIHTLVYNNTVYDQSQNIYFNGYGTAAEDGDVWIFNNVVYTNPVSSTGVNLATSMVCCNINLYNGTTVYILNNTLGNSQNGFMSIFLQSFSDAHVKNNIINNQTGVGLQVPDSSVVAEMDNNLYNGPTFVQWNGASLNTITAVRSTTGFESHGLAGNPLINPFPTTTLQTGSPAIGAGANLTSLGVTQLDSDIIGTARPSTGVWDIGAYADSSSRPDPPTNLRAVVN